LYGAKYFEQQIVNIPELFEYMVQEEIEEFAETLVNHSANVEEGDNVYIFVKSLEALPLFEEVRRKVIEKGAHPYEHILYDSQIGTSGTDRDWIELASEEQLEELPEPKLEQIKEMDAYIRIGGDREKNEMEGVDPEKISKWQSTTREILTERLKLRWVATRYPTEADAETAGLSKEEYEEVVFDSVNNVDWEEMEEKNREIKEIFDEADEVRIVSEDTDLTLSLEGREGVTSEGRHNMPDGEVFYAPKHTSLDGRIRFTYPGLKNGTKVEGIRLEFEDGEIVSYSAETNEDLLEEMIESDEGSHYIGEFGIGTNRAIDQYLANTLFDEKIGGSVHFAIGRAYEECVPEDEERNDSAVHWDIVKDLRKKEGEGGKIIVDGEVVQEGGEWVY